MPSFDTVNYSLRQNKSIQRQIAFEVVQSLSDFIDIRSSVYVGFGSIWFSDFHIAHKRLGIRKMISLECDDVGFKRAEYNKPFRCVDVRNGYSYDLLPGIAKEAKYSIGPWICWLDYDGPINEDISDELSHIPEFIPDNSILLVTVNSVAHRYGKPNQRLANLNQIFGDIFPASATRSDVNESNIPTLIGGQILDLLSASATRIGRGGGFLPAFHLPYRDGAQMVTVGGIFPSASSRQRIKQALASNSLGFPARNIETPPLTIKESVALQAKLPSQRRITRAGVRRIGFDLTDEQIESFEAFYRYYPHFAQLT